VVIAGIQGKYGENGARFEYSEDLLKETARTIVEL